MMDQPLIYRIKYISIVHRMLRPHTSTCYLLHAGFLLGLFFDTENGDEIFLRNVGWLLTDYTALCPRRYVQSLV